MDFTPRLEQAICKAAQAHDGHKRKGTDIPYIIHPFGVMCIAAATTKEEDVLIAGLMHDVLEDVPERYPREQMAQDFGHRVVTLVDALTKPDGEGSWKEKRLVYIAHMEEADADAVILSGADKLHNLMSILKDHDAIGDDLWNRFNATKEDQAWYYRRMADVVGERLPGTDLSKRLDGLAMELERRVNIQ
jgi:(p)ppGpp synthase/HD superfamily hydrolase